MARARLIKPGFYANEQLAECSLLARFIFPGLWMLADRKGRLEDRPKRIKAALLPYDDADVNALLGELSNNGLLVRYCIGEQRLIQINSFEKHQNCHVREPESAYPAPEQAVPSTVPAPVEHTTGPAEALNGNPLTEAENTVTRAAPAGVRPEVWEAWRRHRGKKLTRDAVRLQTIELEKLAVAGDDPNDVIEQSIRNTWAGLFAIDRGKRATGPPTTAGERRADVADQMFRRGKHATGNGERDITSTAERVD